MNIANKIKDTVKEKVLKQEPVPQQAEELIEEEPKEPSQQDRYFQDMSDEQAFGVERQASAKDTTGIWDKKVFSPMKMQQERLSKLIVPSMAMSNYPTKVDIIPELSVAQNRLIYGQLERLLVLEDRFNKNKDKYWLYEENIDPNENPFTQHIMLLAVKLEAGNKSYLSIDMSGLKEMNAERRHIAREDKKPLEDKIGGGR
jgi:hypothetical protein